MDEKVQEKVFDFAAIDPAIERLIESPTERKYGGTDLVRWGDRNTYPQYIFGLTKEAPTLRSIIGGYVDYICGNAVNTTAQVGTLAVGYVDRRGTTLEEFVRSLAQSVATVGGLAVKVTLNKARNGIAELESLPVQYLRSDEDNEVFWYSEKWDKGGQPRVEYPRYIPGTIEPESIFFKKFWGTGTYPEPLFVAAVKSCECERAIDDYHLGNLARGFMGSYLVNFNNGVIPTDQMKKETERSFTEKFAGHSNAGRIMFSWNRNKDAQTTFQKMEVSDYGEKYKTLAEHCRQQIFTAFRAHPTLFGLAESSGFNAEEYEGAFKLFNRTMVAPIQKRLIGVLEYLTGAVGAFTIQPFTMDGAIEKEVQ